MTRVWLHLGCDLRSEVGSLTILQPAVVITTLSCRARARAPATKLRLSLYIITARGAESDNKTGRKKINETADSFPPRVLFLFAYLYRKLKKVYVCGFVIL